MSICHERAATSREGMSRLLVRRGLCRGLAPTHHRRRAPVLAATRGDHSHSHHHHREGPPDVTIKWVFKKSGEAIETPAYFGENLLRLAQRHDIPLEGACEGVTACSTCHCILEDDFFDELEEGLHETHASRETPNGSGEINNKKKACCLVF